ncbi:hypothetical protein FBULB1_3074 [Fusarium bulbicola]|nr:hypothetical protein FBULB1_3074 [Fusarium bulbicola]
MPERLEEDPQPLFGFTEDYFSDNIADEDASARGSAKYWKRQEKIATAAKKAVRKEIIKAIEEKRRTKRPLRKAFKRDCERFRKKERQGREEATVPPLAEIDTEGFAGLTVSLKSRCQAHRLATDAWQDKSLDVLALWTDGSVNAFDGGAAVVFMDKSLGWEQAIPREIGWQVTTAVRGMSNSWPSLGPLKQPYSLFRSNRIFVYAELPYSLTREPRLFRGVQRFGTSQYHLSTR